MDFREEILYMKTGDTQFSVTEQLVDANGAPIVLPGGTTVAYHQRQPDGSVLSGAGSVVDGVNGIVRYSWSGGGPTIVGEHRREWQVTIPSVGTLTVPNYKDGYPVIVTAQLA